MNSWFTLSLAYICYKLKSNFNVNLVQLYQVPYSLNCCFTFHFVPKRFWSTIRAVLKYMYLERNIWTRSIVVSSVSTYILHCYKKSSNTCRLYMMLNTCTYFKWLFITVAVKIIVSRLHASESHLKLRLRFQMKTRVQNILL